MSQARTESATRAGAGPVFAALTGLTSLSVFVQAILAGQFVSQRGRDSWISAHNVVADIVCVLALVTAGYAVARLRSARSDLVSGSVVLLVAVIVQTLTGHLITDGHHDGWIGVHVPLAFAILALTTWLSLVSARGRRG
jgi:lipopolysaccharide export LptBFGC system permease protein LptF